MKKIEAIIPSVKLDEVKAALVQEGILGMTLFELGDYAPYRRHVTRYRGFEHVVDILPRIKIEIIVEDEELRAVTNAILGALRTGHLEDGQLTIFPVEAVIRLRTGVHS
jgi:nitrogen regulatory protein P-II 1